LGDTIPGNCVDRFLSLSNTFLFFRSGNVTNRLALLSNTQFVESRVADDDDETFDVAVDKNVADKNAEPHPEEVFCRKVGEALLAGADFVDGTFETVDVSFDWAFGGEDSNPRTSSILIYMKN